MQWEPSAYKKNSFTKDDFVFVIFHNAAKTVFIKQQYHRGVWIIMVIIITLSNIAKF